VRIVISGATGNIGTALLRRLLADGEHELVGLARRPPVRGKRAEESTAERVRWTSVDLTRGDCRPALDRALTDADAVVHLAWGFQPSHDQRYLEELGVGGTRRVLEAAVAQRVPHLVHMSSVGAYSPKSDDRPVDETYPTDGVRSSVYSRHKAAVERLLDEYESQHSGVGDAPTNVTRLRPGIVGQRAAGSALLRYGVPSYLPGRAITLLPLLPLDRRMAIPMVHADDVADAVVRVITRSAYGSFNLAAPPPITPAHIAAVLEARHVHVPARVLRVAVTGSWLARLQPLDPGWLDLAMKVPLMDCTRARNVLGWTPSHSADSVLHETVAALRDSAAASTPALRPRTVVGQLQDLIRHGPITSRPQP
jgi:nucleoside-diphosphate-sugar epimerase